MKTKIISRFLFSYYYEGLWWSLEVPAYSKEDALGIINKLPLARYDGILVHEFKLSPFFVVKWFQNFSRGLKKLLSYL
jgi:hypothetical protein